MAGVVPRTTSSPIGSKRTLCTHTPPAIRSFCDDLAGFLLQWPTLLTLIMFPILLLMYSRLAIKEEAEMSKQFGAVYDSYAQQTPRFIPKFGHKTTLP